ncbi:MAG: glycosyltransferase, partial [Candidatus Dadabacteria bacterium]
MRRGHQVYYLSLDPPPDEKISSGVNFKKIPFFLRRRRGLLFWGLFTLWCPLYALAAVIRIKPDRLLAFGAYYSCMFFPSRLLTGTPVVLFLRSLVFKIDRITGKPRWLRFFTETVEKTGLKNASKIICMTEAMKNELLEFAPSINCPIEILPNDITPPVNSTENVEIKALKELPTDAFVVMTAGVIDRRKNIGLLIDALKRLEEIDPCHRVYLIVCGDGPLLQHYREVASRKKLKRIYFTGWCDNLEPIWNKTSLLVHPSLHEGVPNII